MQTGKAIQALNEGAIGVLATDTLYGLCGSALLKQSVERIYDIKGRDEGKPFIVLISDISDLKKFGIKLSKEEGIYLQTVWPGPVSVILPCPLKKFAYLHRGTSSLAFRLPKNPKLRALLRKTGPLAAPSANPQGQPPAETIAEAKNYFGKKADFYLAGGRKQGKPSRIVSLVSGTPVDIRK